MNPTSILLVEPDLTNREHLVNLLHELEADVLIAPDSASALAFLDREPDLVILNERVKGLTPEQMLEELQQRELDTFLIITSNTPDLGHAMKWLVSGAFACLEHPVTFQALQPVIEKGLENKEAYYQVVAMAQELKNANDALEREKAALKEKTEDLRFLYDLGSELGSTLNSREVVKIVARALSRVAQADLVLILTAMQQPGNELMLYPSRAIRPSLAGELAEELLHGMNGSSGGGTPRYVSYESGGPETPLARKPRHRLNLPLTVAGKDCGLVGLYHFRPKQITPDRRLLLESVTMLSAQALYNAFQHEQALRMASHDPLTGLMNRRAFEENLHREFERYLRYSVNLSVIMIDLDHFKSVNDRFGHKTGDQVLQAVAGIVRESVRATDITARLGGEEFAVILPETDQNQAARLAQRIAQRLKLATVPVDGVRLKQTVSQGVADTSLVELTDADELIRLADKAMYLAKEQGRNTIRTASELPDIELGKGRLYAWPG